MPITLNGDTGITTPSYGGVDVAEYIVPVTAFKNRIINGAMMIDQRNAGASVPSIGVNSVYLVDRWGTYCAPNSGLLSGQRNQGGVTPPIGFTNYLGLTSLGNNPQSGASEVLLRQPIEGFNTADLLWGTANAATVTLSFWVRSSLTGTFSGNIRNFGNWNRSYVFTYTINSANTWEYKTITITGDTTGSWNGATNTGSLDVGFDLGAGSSFRTSTTNAWTAGGFNGATGSVSIVGTSGATFYITGVQLEKGSTATSFDYRPYGTELALCQRYCFVYRPSTNYAPYLMAHGINTTSMRGLLKFPQTMRAAPSLTFTAANTFQWSFGNVATSISLAEQGIDMSSVDIGSTGLAANGGYMLTSANNTTSYIIGSSEL